MDPGVPTRVEKAFRQIQNVVILRHEIATSRPSSR
jgi:hypothetical protein